MRFNRFQKNSNSHFSTLFFSLRSKKMQHRRFIHFVLLFKNVLNDLHKDNRKNLRMYSLGPNIFKISQNFMDESS